MRSSIGVPVSVEGRVWGCIVVGFSRPGLLPLPADTEAQLAGFIELVATAIANTESRAALARLAEEQAALRRVATLVAHGAAPEQVFAVVTEEYARLVPVDVAGMARLEPDGTISYVASWGRAVDFIPVGSRWTLDGENVATVVFETGRPTRVESQAGATGSLADLVRALGVRSLVATPVVVEGRLWGELRRRLDPGAAAAAGRRGAAGLVHRAGGDGDRERRQPGQADGLPGADRRRRR